MASNPEQIGLTLLDYRKAKEELAKLNERARRLGKMLSHAGKVLAANPVELQICGLTEDRNYLRRPILAMGEHPCLLDDDPMIQPDDLDLGEIAQLVLRIRALQSETAKLLQSLKDMGFGSIA